MRFIFLFEICVVFLLFSEQLCKDQEQCEIVSEIPDCDEIAKNNLETNEIDESTNRNYYSVVKRDTTSRKIIRIPNRNGNMKIKVYTKISRGLGLWNQNLSRAENIDVVKQELKTYHTNEQLRNQLQSLRINVKHLNLEENLLCRMGSVLKRNICGKFLCGFIKVAKYQNSIHF